MSVKLTKFFSLFLVFMTITFSSAFPNRKTDTEAIADNVAEGLIDGSLSVFAGPDIADPAAILALTAEDENGHLYFTDIDYENSDRATWPAARHLTRTEMLALQYRRSDDPEKKALYLDTVLRLLDHWIEEDYVNPNWWHNKLSNPNILGETCLLIKDRLEGKRLVRLAELVGRGSFTLHPTLYAYTGANATDIAMSTIKYGALIDSGNAIRTAVRVVSDTLKLSSGEGLRQDGTFFQHGNRLYMGGYGIDFIHAAGKIIKMLTGTSYGFTAEQLEPFAHFVLDGMRVMSYGKTLDPSTMGRSVSRINAQPLGSIVSELLSLSEVEEMPRREEFRAYAASIAADAKTDFGLRFYEDSNFIVINNDGFYFSFKGGKKDLVYSEIINDENILGYNSSFPGVTTIMTTGREYTDISPLFDYSLVPGATAVYETDEQLRQHPDFSYRMLPGTYAGTGNGKAAVSAASVTHEGVSMTVACFATENAAVLLGAEMKNKAGSPMITTVDQCFYAGSHVQNGNTVLHNGVKYTLLEGGTLTAQSTPRTGSWRRNNLTMPDITAQGDLFTVTFDCTGSYAYSVMAQDTDAEFTVIENTAQCQAVKLPDGSIAAVFYTKGAFTYEGATYSGKAGEAVIFA